jgi:hypothetical protein
MTASPENYFIGKGIVYFKKTGDADYRDLGNAPALEFTPELEELEHFSSREGVRTRDKVVVQSKSATLRITLEEFTLENLSLALLGDLDELTNEIDIFANNAVTGQLRYVGTNEVGTKFQVDFPNVSIIPEGSLGFITDEWGQIELNCEVGVDTNGKFGTLKPWIAEALPLPANIALPAISGTAQEGQTLTAFPGVWTNAFGFTYQWQEEISTVWTNITGATSSTLVVPGGSTIGRPLRVVVTASNSTGTATANSAPTANVIAE